jgi:hypothetical protein
MEWRTVGPVVIEKVSSRHSSLGEGAAQQLFVTLS